MTRDRLALAGNAGCAVTAIAIKRYFHVVSKSLQWRRSVYDG